MPASALLQCDANTQHLKTRRRRGRCSASAATQCLFVCSARLLWCNRHVVRAARHLFDRRRPLSPPGRERGGGRQQQDESKSSAAAAACHAARAVCRGAGDRVGFRSPSTLTPRGQWLMPPDLNTNRRIRYAVRCGGVLLVLRTHTAGVLAQRRATRRLQCACAAVQRRACCRARREKVSSPKSPAPFYFSPVTARTPGRLVDPRAPMRGPPRPPRPSFFVCRSSGSI